jgi:hypothetical protein
VQDKRKQFEKGKAHSMKSQKDIHRMLMAKMLQAKESFQIDNSVYLFKRVEDEDYVEFQIP